MTACVHVPKREGGRGELVESFTTMTADLLALRDWLQGLGLTQVAMEATGVYWKPVWYLLEDDFELLLCNAGHVKNVPGRKTDVSDAQWLCQLLEHGLLRSSFVPPKPIRELRDLTRYRKTLIRERPREANRLHKVLEDAGIKLACVASDVLGVSGRAMIEALVAGEGDPSVLAELARGRLRAKLPALQRALEGRFSAHHALLCSHILAHLDYLLEVVESLSEEIDKRTRPFARELKQLDTIHRRRQAPSRIDPGRAQPRHEPLPLPSPLRPLGQAQPRQRRVSRQTPLRQDRPRQTPGCARS